MPYAVNWFIENEVIYIRYIGALTADEYRECLVASKDMIESSPRSLVHVINDVGDVTEPLSPKESLKVLREVGTPARIGWSILIREKSVLIKMGVAFGTSFFKMRNRAYDTMEEAEAYLRDVDSTIHWDLADRSVLVAE